MFPKSFVKKMSLIDWLRVRALFSLCSFYVRVINIVCWLRCFFRKEFLFRARFRASYAKICPNPKSILILIHSPVRALSAFLHFPPFRIQRLYLHESRALSYYFITYIWLFLSLLLAVAALLLLFRKSLNLMVIYHFV